MRGYGGLKPIILGLIVGAPWTACAQTSAAASPAVAPFPGGAAVEDITVTAQRRTQSLSKVPLPVQAIDAASLAQQVVLDTKALVELSPSVGYQGGFSINAGGFLIRGVTSNSSEGGIQQSTAMLIDGVPLTRPGEFVNDLGDVERIEVLRGPQGTLIGKNATAGVISIVTRRPKDRFEAQIEAGATTETEYNLRGMINLPLSDSVRARVSTVYSHLDPLVRNFGSQGDVYGRELYAVRGKIEADLTDKLQLLVSGEYNYQRNSFTQAVLFEPNTGFAALQTAALGYQPRLGLVQVNTNGAAIEDATGYNASAELTWKIAERLVFTSLSAYRHFGSDNNSDNDLTPVGFGIGGLAPNPLNYPIQYIDTGLPRNPTGVKYFTQETRLNYSGHIFDVVAGIFFQTSIDQGSNTVPFLIANRTLPAGSLIYSNVATRYRIGDDTLAAFGDVVGRATDTVSLFGGMRFTHESVSVNYNAQDFGPIGARLSIATPGLNFDSSKGEFLGPPLETRSFDLTADTDNLTGRAGIQWQPTQSQNYYFSYNRGYKGPAVDVSRAARAPDPANGYTPIVAPEDAYSLELGTKLRLFDNRLQIAANLFDQRIENLQQNVLIAGTNSTLLINAGALKTRGVEFDFRSALTRGLSVDGAAAYTDANYTGRFSDGRPVLIGCYPGQTAAQGCTGGQFSIAGIQARGSYRWRYNVGANYSDALSALPFELKARVGWSWYDSTPQLLGIDPVTREGSHGLLDASLTFADHNGRWSLQIYGKNLTDEFFFAYRSNADNFLGRGYGWLSRDYQRTSGVRLTYNF